MEEPDAPEEPAAPDPAPEEPAPAEEAPEEEPAQPDAAPEIAEPPVDVDGGGGLGDGLAKSVGLAFSGPTQNMQSVFKLVFDVVQKQQVVISTLREEVNDMRDEYPRRLSALENEVAELKVALADATALGAAPAPNARVVTEGDREREGFVAGTHLGARRGWNPFAAPRSGGGGH